MVLTVRVGARRDGTLTAIDLHALSNAGAYGYHGTTTVTLAGGKALPIYNHVAASRFTYDVAYTNTTPGGAYRGYGATQGCFAVESAVNEMADELGMDPCELRLKNLVKPGETLWQLNDEPLHSCRLDECLMRAMEMAGWKDRPLSEDLGDRVRGLGVALTMQGSGIAMVDIANVDIRLEDDGFYVLSIGATDVGTGADTILAQMAAEALGCDVDRVVTKGVDTDTSPFDTGAYASSGTYTTGGAVVRAAEDLKRQIREQAARLWDVDERDVEFDGESVRCDGREMGVGELANKLIGFGLNPGMLEGHGANSQPTSPPPYMAGIAEVEVDKATGLVRVTDYAAVVDCGTVINPALARGAGRGRHRPRDRHGAHRGRLPRREGAPPHGQLHDLQAPHPPGRARAARGVHAELRAHGALWRQVHRRGGHQHALARGHERRGPRHGSLRAQPAHPAEQGPRRGVAAETSQPGAAGRARIYELATSPHGGRMFKLRRYLAGHYVECVLAPLFKMLEALLQLLVPLVMAQVIDVGIPARDAGYVLAHGALLAGMGVFAWGVSITAQYFSARLSASFGTALRDDLFAHVLALSREDVERLGRASLVTRLTNDSQQVQDGLNMFFRLILRSPFVTFGTVVAAFIVDGVEGAALLAAVLAAGAVVLGFMRLTTDRYRDIQRGLDDVQLRVAENLEGVRVLRAFRQEPAERAAFAATAATVRDRQVSTGDLSALVNPLTYAAINCGLIALLWLGGFQVNVGNLTQGQLVALVGYVSQALVELLKLTNLIVLLAKASACARRLNEVFETTPALADGTEPAEPAPNAPVLAFDDVSFAYPDAGGEALSHVSFALAPGGTLGVIGGTGSGKSTLASLALRFYDATAGRVTVGGQDVRGLTRRTLRRQVSLVEQGATLFSGTIASNLRWGRADADERDLRAALATAQAAGVAQSKAGGLDAEVEQFGRNFSGGQRQRLTIARALVRRPRVLILDDASSALDFATDAALRRAIGRDCADMAVVTISQRVTAVRHADQILVLDGGRQAGLGTHEELLASCPVYREICASQLTDEEVAR